MKSKRNVTNVTFDEIRIGAAEESTVTLNRTQIDLMALVSGDVDAFHLTGESGVGAPKRPERRSPRDRRPCCPTSSARAFPAPERRF